jgi:hypothetical protein
MVWKAGLAAALLVALAACGTSKTDRGLSGGAIGAGLGAAGSAVTGGSALGGAALGGAVGAATGVLTYHMDVDLGKPFWTRLRAGPAAAIAAAGPPPSIALSLSPSTRRAWQTWPGERIRERIDSDGTAGGGRAGVALDAQLRRIARAGVPRADRARPAQQVVGAHRKAYQIASNRAFVFVPRTGNAADPAIVPLRWRSWKGQSMTTLIQAADTLFSGGAEKVCA